MPKKKMLELDTESYEMIDGKETAVGVWNYKQSPKVGQKVKIDDVPLVVKGVKRRGCRIEIQI